MLKAKFDYNTKPIEKKYSKLFSDDSSVIVDELSLRVMKDVKKYVPRDSGNLVGSAKYVKGSGIQWDTKYAKYVYNGKTSTGRDMVYDRSKSKYAGPRWTERYVAENQARISSFANTIVKKHSD